MSRNGITEKPTLSIKEQSFIAEYQKNGFNATKAYLKINPLSSYESAKSRGYELVTRSHIQQALQANINKQGIEITRPYLTDRFIKIADKAEEKQEFSPAISALRQVGELNDLYQKDEGSADKYINVLQQFAIQNVVINQSGVEVVDNVGKPPDIEVISHEVKSVNEDTP